MDALFERRREMELTYMESKQKRCSGGVVPFFQSIAHPDLQGYSNGMPLHRTEKRGDRALGRAGEGRGGREGTKQARKRGCETDPSCLRGHGKLTMSAGLAKKVELPQEELRLSWSSEAQLAIRQEESHTNAGT